MSWSEHVNYIVKEASKKLGIIRRVFADSDMTVKEQLYKQLILSKLEYCGNVWDPYLLGQQQSLERIQKRAARIILSNWDVCYADALNELNWPSLHTRRLANRQILCYKILNGLIDIPASYYFQFRHCRDFRSTHEYQLQGKFARTNTCKYSYFYRTVNDWNSIPLNVILSPSLQCFKNSLHLVNNVAQSCALNKCDICRI